MGSSLRIGEPPVARLCSVRQGAYGWGLLGCPAIGGANGTRSVPLVERLREGNAFQYRRPSTPLMELPALPTAASAGAAGAAGARRYRGTAAVGGGAMRCLTAS